MESIQQAPGARVRPIGALSFQFVPVVRPDVCVVWLLALVAWLLSFLRRHPDSAFTFEGKSVVYYSMESWKETANTRGLNGPIGVLSFH